MPVPQPKRACEAQLSGIHKKLTYQINFIIFKHLQHCSMLD